MRCEGKLLIRSPKSGLARPTCVSLTASWVPCWEADYRFISGRFWLSKIARLSREREQKLSRQEEIPNNHFPLNVNSIHFYLIRQLWQIIHLDFFHILICYSGRVRWCKMWLWENGVAWLFIDEGEVEKVEKEVEVEMTDSKKWWAK